MRKVSAVTVLILAAWSAPSTPSASQQSSTQGASADVIKLGRRVFEQRCSVCHTIPAPRRYAPALYNDLVERREEAARQYIMNGSKRMPAFRHGLQASQIDAIIEYLKTLPQPPAQGDGSDDISGE